MLVMAEETFSLATPISCEDGFRDASMENRILTAIQTYFQPAAVSGNEDSPVADADFIISQDDQAAFLFLDRDCLFYELAEVFISSNMKRIQHPCQRRGPAVGVSVSNGLLEIDIHSDSLPYEELAGILNSYRRRQKYYKLKSGEFLKLENNSLSVLSELADGLRLSDRLSVVAGFLCLYIAHPILMPFLPATTVIYSPIETVISNH